MFASFGLFTKLVKDAFRIPRWRLEVGDLVEVNSGACRGRSGRVTVVDHTRNALKVKGLKLLNVAHPEGGRRNVERFIHYSNVNLVDPILKQPTRIAVRLAPDGSLIRISKKSGAVIPLPDRVRTEVDTSEAVEGAKDTSPEVALQKTYHSEHEVATMKNVRQKMRKYNHDLH